MYSPKIEESLVRLLYKLKKIEKRPMTKLANEAVREYLNRKAQIITEEHSNEERQLHRRAS